MSFGYYDNDWVDPDIDDYEAESGEIVIEFNRDVFTMDGGAAEFKDNAKFTDYYDEEYDVLVLDGESIYYDVIEALSDKLPTRDGVYMISGWVSIPYVIYDQTGYSRGRVGYDDVEVELPGNPIAGDISIQSVK